MDKLNISCASYDDLTTFDLKKKSTSLDFEFAKAREGYVEEIGSSSQLSVIKRIKAPNVIRFAPQLELVNKIKEKIKLYQIPRSYDRNSGYYEIPADHNSIFFDAIKELQGVESRFNVPSRMFHILLGKLQKHEHISIAKREEIERDIQTCQTLDDYKKEAEYESDLKKIISVALYYRNKKSKSSLRRSLYWLCKAQSCLSETSIAELIDLESFVDQYEKITTSTVFYSHYKDIANAFSKSQSLISLQFASDTEYTLELAEGIGSFISQTNSVQIMDLSSVWSCSRCYKLDHRTIEPIAEALKINTSIIEINFADTSIGDKGLKLLLEAIRSNSKTKIKYLNLFSCGLTNESAKILLEFIKDKEQIRRVNISCNRSISKELNKEVKDVLNERAIEDSLSE